MKGCIAAHSSQAKPRTLGKQKRSVQDRKSGALAAFVTDCLDKGGFGTAELEQLDTLPDGFGAQRACGQLSVRDVQMLSCS